MFDLWIERQWMTLSSGCPLSLRHGPSGEVPRLQYLSVMHEAIIAAIDTGALSIE
jgi:hypothetical protein